MAQRQSRTFFASVERVARPTIHEQYTLFATTPLLVAFLDAVVDPFMILNPQRQMVYGNQTLLDMLHVADIQALLGQRPGEAIRCVHAFEMEGGCGTGEACRTCGALRVVLDSMKGQQMVGESRLSLENGNVLDLRVSSTPLTLEDGQRYSMVVLSDISDRKRREVLERLFFHDILNLAGGIMGYAYLLMDDPQKLETPRVSRSIYQTSVRLIDEIKHHRTLHAAENNDLTLRYVRLQTRDLLSEIQLFFKAHDAAQNRPVVISPESIDVAFMSDQVLCGRVLGNLVKNGLEAPADEQVVTLASWRDGDHVVITVHNWGYIPRPVQLQIFQRSFSTKGDGRGLGTYSAKLFTEQYLGGSLTFTTSREEGTTFTVRWPLGLNGSGTFH